MTFNVTFKDPTRTYANYYEAIQSNIVAAGLNWNKYIHGSGNLDINVDFALTGTSVATGGSSFVFSDSGNALILQSVASEKLSTGIDQNGAEADVSISINPAFLSGSQAIWFDPDPLTRTTPIPIYKTDAVSVFTHELGHALGFIGFKNEINGTLPANYQSAFDQKTSFDGTNFFFTGTRATAVYGGSVPLTFGSISHLGNDAPRPGSNLLTDMMAPIAILGRNYISKLDLAILADCGLPIDPVRNDFNNDGKSDILWRNNNGSVALWKMDGATVTSSSLTSTPSIDSSWKAVGTGDFTGGGKSDILWRNNNGSIALWKMDGSTVVSSSLTSTPALDNSWKTVGTGDYNGDGKADILWRNDNGSIALWQMDGSTVVSSSRTSTPALDNSWKVAGNSDFNGDGKADILWRNDDGSVALWQMNGAAVSASATVSKVTSDWKIAGTGDFNGDGKADILWRNDNGSISLWQMDGSAISSSSKTSTPALDSSWNVADIGDYNGDGKSDILWRNTSGAVDIWQMDGSTVVASTLTSIAADSSWKIAAPII
jgi:FG-GAP-like repeat